MKKLFYNKYLIKKHFGQVFLKNQKIVDVIINTIQPNNKDIMVEIGPGFGVLTQKIIQFIDHITVIEIDKTLATRLNTYSFNNKKIDVIHKDVTMVDFHELSNQIGKPLRIFGNLPYNMSIKIIFHLFKYTDIIHDMCFMLQYEVAQRLSAKPNNKHYGKLSIIAQYHCNIKNILIVPSNAFIPIPKVNSMIVKFTPHINNPYPITDINKLTILSNIAFNKRRKTIKNSLKTLIHPKEIKKQGINLTLRAENLKIEQFCNLANIIKI